MMCNQDPSIQVSILCLVYNHKKYLRDCFDGFIMQRTNFRFEVVVHDDASSDGSQTIISEYTQKYPDIFVPIFETVNQYSTSTTFIFNLLKNKCRGRYLSYCEGDDYWTYPNKLQEQYDYMEEHKDIGLCYTDYCRFNETCQVLSNPIFHSGEKRPNSFEEHLLSLGYIAPMTWCMRKSIFSNITVLPDQSDTTFAMALDFFAISKVGYINTSTAVHIIHEGSAAHPISNEKMWAYKYGVFQTQLRYLEKYQYDNLRNNVMISGYLRLLPLAVSINKSTFIAEANAYLKTQSINVDEFLSSIIELHQIYQSHTYKLAHIIAKPLSWIKKLIHF